MKRLVLTLLMSLFYFVSYGQNKITGTVKGADGEPLYGTVKVKGTNRAVMTDVDGNYAIEANQGDVLEFSSTNMKTKEIRVSSNVIDVILEEDIESLGEVIVVAYGTAKKSTFTGSAAVVSEKRIQEAQVSNVSNALQGTGSGIQAISSTGQPGEGSNIRIRGVGSISGSSDPLIVLDGVPYDGNLSSINPTDIASMTVLKDAASASIYGSRAANGVIVISTRQGLKDKDPSINVRSILGISNRAVAPVKLMGTNQWMELRWEALRNGRLDQGDNSRQAAQYATNNLIADIGINPYGIASVQPVGIDGKLKSGLNLLWDDNWDKQIVGSGQRFETNVDVSGGSKNTQYFFSGGYLNEKGMIIRSGFERFSARLNLTNQTKKWLKINLNMNYAYSVQDFNDSQDSNIGNAMSFGLNIPNFYPIYQRNPNTGEFILDVEGNKKYDFGRYRTSSFARNNLLASLPMSKNERKRNLLSIRSGAEIDISELHSILEDLEGLKYKINYSTDISFLQTHTFTPTFIDDPNDSNSLDVIQNLPNITAGRYTYLTRSYTINHVLSYNKIIDEIHNISFLAGQETYEYIYTYEGGSRSGLPTEGYDEPVLGANITAFTGLTNRYSLYSVFGKAEYTLMDKYNLSASYRRDGSSRFHTNNRWGNFWSVGIGWNLEKENFIKDNLDFIDLLKFRSSYGTSGNQSLIDASGNQLYYAFTDLYATGRVGSESAVGISSLGNPDLVWEGNVNLNIGFDYSLFEGRISGSLEWFQRISDNLIYNIPLPSSTGFSSVIRNVGEMRNRGIEFEIKGTIIKTENIKWNLGFNITHYKNLITKFPIEGGVIGTYQRIMEGKDRYAFYMREWAGNSKTGETAYDYNNNIDKKIIPVVLSRPGQPLWWIYDETTGKKYKTANYNNATRQEYGSSIPDFYGGINTDLKIFDFTLSALFSYSIGGYLYTAGDYTQFLNPGTTKARTILEDMNNRWTPENQNNDFPRLSTQATSNTFTSISTRFLYDASYMRLKTITLSYNIPKVWLKDNGIENIGFFIQGENLFTIFGLDGVDPESGGLAGITGYRYPAARVFSGGISLKF